MEFLSNGLTLHTGNGSFPISTDSMLLADFVRLPSNASVLDLGAGCGTLGILLCAKNKNCRITGIELDPSAHEAATENIARNQLQCRMESICGDLRHVSLPSGYFSVCLSNPPYFSGGPTSKEHPFARRENYCSPTQLFAVAAKALKFGGDFFIVHKPERLAELIACGARENLEAKHLRLVRHREDRDISLILLSFRKGGKPGLRIDEVSLFDKENKPTAYYKAVYHIT